MKNPYIKMSTPWIQFEICNKGNISDRKILNILRKIKKGEFLPDCRTGYNYLDKQLEKVGIFIWNFYILNDYSRVFYNDRCITPQYKKITKKEYREILDKHIKKLEVSLMEMKKLKGE